MSCETLFLEQLRKHGFRMTLQREAVLAVLHELEGLETAEAITARLQRMGQAVDKSTLYRTLDLLHAFGLVSIVEQGDGHRRYALVATHGEHVHLVCRACGAVVTAECDLLEGFIAQMGTRHGFAVDAASLQFEGLCRTCQVEEQQLPAAGEPLGAAEV